MRGEGGVGGVQDQSVVPSTADWQPTNGLNPPQRCSLERAPPSEASPSSTWIEFKTPFELRGCSESRDPVDTSTAPS